MNKILLNLDPWLSKFFKSPVYQVVKHDGEVLKSEYTDFPLSQNKYSFYFTKVKLDDILFISYLEDYGFHLIDTNITWIKKDLFDNEFNLQLINECKYEISHATNPDELSIAKLSSRSFSSSRFHLDPLISNKTANEIKASWTRNFFKGKRGDLMIVAKDGEKLVSFLQIIISDFVMVIDLIAVDPEYRCQGVSKAMIAFALKSIGNIKEIKVGTQLSNQVAMKFYQNLGFVIDNASYIFHKHIA